MEGKSRRAGGAPYERFNVTVTVADGFFAATTRDVAVTVAPAAFNWFFTTWVRRNAID
jgi:hypothetical protein